MSTVLSVRNHRFSKHESEANGNGKSRFDTTGLAPVDKATEKSVLFIGFDWGTNKSCLRAAYAGKPETAIEQIVPTVVG